MHLAEAVLESLTSIDNETVAQNRGDGISIPGVTNEYLIQMIKDYLIQLETIKERSNESKSKDESKEDAKSQKDTVSEISAISVQDEKLRRQIDLEQFLIKIIEYEAPIRHCFFFRNTLWTKHFAVGNSINILTYVSLYAILNKMNLIAVFYWVLAWLIQKNNFRPNIFKTSPSQVESSKYNSKAQFSSAKNKSLRLLLKILIGLISTMIILQMAFSVYTNIQSTHQEELQRSISDNFCPNPQRPNEEDEYDEDGNIYQTAQSFSQNGDTFNKDCAKDWSYFLLSMPASSQSDEESQ